MTPDEALETISPWEFEPGKGGLPRVPEWVAPMLAGFAPSPTSPESWVSLVAP